MSTERKFIPVKITDKKWADRFVQGEVFMRALADFGVWNRLQNIENAKINAGLNNITNAEFKCADSTDTQKGILKESDVVILDPPRKGVTKELIEKISESDVKRVVYVSCSPDTLARDVKRFMELGYTCDEVTPFDMFPRTGHVESVVCLTQRNELPLK